jgi:y4mF family transcriptional regulator
VPRRLKKPVKGLAPGPLATFVRERRRALGYTQPELAERAGTGLRFIRELEQGKRSLRLDKVNQVLAFFGAEMRPVAVSETGRTAGNEAS